MSRICAASSRRGLKAVTAMGTFCRFSERRWAVTTTSSTRPPLSPVTEASEATGPGPAGVAPARGVAGAVVGWARAGRAAARASTEAAAARFTRERMGTTSCFVRLVYV